MVKNEAEIIAEFIKHNLQYLDELHIIVQESTDDTLEISLKLAADGLPVKCYIDRDLQFFQGEKVGRLAKELLRDRCEIVVLLDADEFIKVTSPSHFAGALEDLQPHQIGIVEWTSYIPTEPPPDGEQTVTGSITHRLQKESYPTFKCILSRAFLGEELRLMEGAHFVYHVDTYKPVGNYAKFPEFSLAHFPVRSIAQLTNKVSHGLAALPKAYGAATNVAYHWRKIASILDQRPLDFFDLQLIAADYQFRTGIWEQRVLPDLVNDPVGKQSRPLR